jgi:hypothetical protein
VRSYNLQMRAARFFLRATMSACALVVIGSLCLPASAQDPLKVAPQAYKLQMENDWTRVIRVHYGPFEKLAVHDHPPRQAIFIYLNNGGPVLFKHVEGVSGTYPATRPATTAGAYRLAGVQPENHVVENLSEIPNDFLQVELKTEIVEPKTFRGRFFAEASSKQGTANYRKVEFENPQVRITRIVCAARAACDPLEVSHPALFVALSPARLKATNSSGKSSQVKLGLGETKWLGTEGFRQWQNTADLRAEQLLIEFKTRPAKSTGNAEKHGHN